MALIGSGLLLGFLAPGRHTAAALGVFLGQLVFLLGRVLANPGSNGLWVIGVFFLAGYTLLTLMGAALAGRAHALLRGSRGK